MEAKIQKKIEKFLEVYPLVKFQKNELMYRPNEVTPFLGYLKSGYVRLYTISENGQEISLNIFSPGSFLPLVMTDNKAKNQYYFEAMTSVQTWHLPQKEAPVLIEENPDLILPLLDNSLFGTGSLLSRIESLASGNAYTKVISVFLLLLSDRVKQNEKNIRVDIPLTHRIIASLTGLTRETVTLQMLKLKKKGLVTGRGRNLIVRSLEELKAECSAAERE